MDTLEKTALNEILKTVVYIAEEVKEIKVRLNHLEVNESASSAFKSAEIK